MCEGFVSVEVLLPEAANFDYILRIGGKFTTDAVKKLVEEIKQVPEVIISTEIPLKKIKSKPFFLNIFTWQYGIGNNTIQYKSMVMLFFIAMLKSHTV